MRVGESGLVDDAATQLQALGFFVQREVHLAQGPSVRSFCADIVGWAPDETGELVRDVVVEVKGGRFSQDSLAQLSRIASMAGARRAFIYTGEWLAVDPSFSEARPSPAPRPMHQPKKVRVPDAAIQDALRRMLWESVNVMRGSVDARVYDIRSVTKLLEQLEAAPGPSDRAGLARVPGAELRVARFLAAVPEVVGIPAELASCMARLLEPTEGMAVLDPFCGLGGCLWAVAEEAHRRGVSATLAGWERSPTVLSLTRQLAAFARLDVAVETLDEIPPLPQAPPPSDPATTAAHTSRVLFDAVVSVLPFNVKSPRLHNLATGDQTHSVDLAVLDAVGDWLKPGGRAVLVVAPRLMFAEGDVARVRERLANTMRIVSVIELPAGVFASTKIKCGIVVLEKAAPTKTLVARLDDDWQEQLSSTGEFLRAYQAHLRGHPSP